jgi:CheY-like chemotaxis protein/DNA-binding PadR family transcriptional regulator
MITMSKILVVDDEAIITLQLEEQLHEMGYTVVGMAASGEEAIEKARQLLPDLVLMDIVMPRRRVNGIEAARVILDELDIPVVFVTSYADDAIIEKAKQVRPYGYIVKPFNELEIKAAIEVALFRKAAELEMKKRAEGIRQDIVPLTAPTPAASQGTEYIDLPEIKTVFLKDIFADLLLYLYADPSVKDPLFKSSLEAGIKKGGRLFFAYHHSSLHKYFLQEIQNRVVFIRKIKKGELFLLPQILERCTATLPPSGPAGRLQILFDFSDTEEFDDIIALKKLILEKKEGGIPITGIIALNMTDLDHHHLRVLTEGIAKIIISTGKDTTISYANPTYGTDSFTVVPQAKVEDMVRKLLEPVVLSMLSKPISGYDIVNEIHIRYKVHIPQSRIYAQLYELKQHGYLEMKVSGKSKLYSPTEAGKKYIQQELNEFKFVFQQILGDGSAAPDKEV